jgi:roadblock/LC7 domain-containing protein
MDAPIFDEEFWTGVRSGAARVRQLALTEIAAAEEAMGLIEGNTSMFDEQFWTGVRSGAARVRQLALTEIAAAEEAVGAREVRKVHHGLPSERSAQAGDSGHFPLRLRWIEFVTAAITLLVATPLFLLNRTGGTYTRTEPQGSVNSAAFAPPSVEMVRFSPNSKLLATAGDDTVRLWDVTSLQPLGQPLTGRTVSFSPDGKLVATAGVDDTVRLWDVTSRQPAGQLAGRTVSFSPDGKLVATAGGDYTVRLWGASTGTPIGQPLTGRTVSFSPDGKLLATAGADDTVRVWRVTFGQGSRSQLLRRTTGLSATLGLVDVLLVLAVGMVIWAVVRSLLLKRHSRP